MKRTKFIALWAFCLALTGCASSTPTSKPPSSSEGKFVIQPVLERDRDPYRQWHRRNADGDCRKRGCDNGKLFFNPGESEPSVLDIHRGW